MEKLQIADNYWGITDPEKIKQTITVESREHENIEIALEPFLPIPFDISTED
ncbi:hypothetical protein HY745_11610 [Candidatus Desantisbacteria bacterium]|nr:hypothetical protein [Candidatus Desantisbacteria bacterium]